MKKIFISLLIPFLIIAHTGCEKEPFTITNLLLDTSCTITLYEGFSNGDEMDDEDFEKISLEAFQLIEDFQIMFTKEVSNLDTLSYEGSPEPDIININQNKGSKVQISKDTYTLLSFALELSEVTQGKFDVTVGTLSSLWSFSENPKVPSQSQLGSILPTISYENLEVFQEGNTYSALLDANSSSIDLGGIGKGYIADKVSQLLISKGITEGIVNLGGNTVTIGEKNGKDNWKIGVESSYVGEKEIIGSLSIKNQTAVTSGVYERYFSDGGSTYHHILDPDTGFPVSSNLVSVTIVGPLNASYLADGLSTACLLLGENAAIEFMKDYPDFKYVLVNTDGIITDRTDGIFQNL